MNRRAKRKFVDLNYVKTERRRHHIWAFMLFGSCAVFVVTTFFLFGTTVVHGVSMEPTYHQGQMLFLHRWPYLFENPRAGDVIVFTDPDNPKNMDVKRVIALPGSFVQIYGGGVYVDGRRVQEYYLPKGTITVAHRLNEKKVELGGDQYFLMGDNRDQSVDSRDFGAVNRRAIVGRITRAQV